MKINRKVELTFARGVNIDLHICSLSVGPVGIKPPNKSLLLTLPESILRFYKSFNRSVTRIYEWCSNAKNRNYLSGEFPT
jgi:hypothetical protein